MALCQNKTGLVIDSGQSAYYARQLLPEPGYTPMKAPFLAAARPLALFSIRAQKMPN
jgi:hypothetical protein